MADFDTNDIIRIGAVMEFKTAHAIANVWTAKITSGGGVDYAAMYAKAADYMDILYAHIAAELSDEVLPDYLTLANITQSTVGGAFAWDTFAGGTNVNDPTAAQVAVMAYARTAVPRVQIRKYLGVFTIAHMSNGLWTTAVRTACDDMMGDFITSNDIGGGTLVTGVAYNAALARVTEGRSPHTSQAPVIQRRRREGRGA